ncbi:mannitol-1-phosphate 5-dehydrogenase [Alkalibacillus almallahensis]|uniref:mannitol-1-phosphate 5-dehydrogenase n=1 Tax=Alkalibacillus almallahensis TaxID=1379154 RepID=UPI00141E9E65|nr:mannitol-1-phosphate 5-dehydrogenase [Alkalibacillus almallahensis]NIK11986.1 mannitol-1-phosphate 5-dehydrogenase [Alkalibacillus almallahensis]
MLAVHFGAGNIGRGFIGTLLSDANYHTVFVDVNETIIQEINERKQYPVILAGEEEQEKIVSNISGIVSTEQPEEVSENIAKADIVTTAVGPQVLPIIARNIAEGLVKRFDEKNDYLNVIACENMIGGSSLLKEKVLEHLPQEYHALLEERVGFPDAAVDRIVPNQENEDLLAVTVEPYFEWVVSRNDVKGEVPDIKGITYVEDLTSYIERKLFTVNTGHAAIAYLGDQFGYDTIKEATQDQEIITTVNGALQETGHVLIQLYGFDGATHKKYRKKIVNRFKNPYLNDEITRVARGPKRKLGEKDRLIRPALQYVELFNEAPKYLIKVILSALNYSNEADAEAVELQQTVQESGYAQVLEDVCGLSPDEPLYDYIMDELDN